MIALKADKAGLQKLRQWTIWLAFLTACLWVAADCIDRASAARPIEAIQRHDEAATEWVRWAMTQARENIEHGEAGMRSATDGQGSGRGN